MNKKQLYIAAALGLVLGMGEDAYSQTARARSAPRPHVQIQSTVQPGVEPELPGDQTMSLEEHAQKIYRPGGSVSRAAIGDPDVADVTIIQNRDVLITGKKRGTTTLNVW